MRKKKLSTEEFNWIIEQAMVAAEQPMLEMPFTAAEMGLELEDMPEPSPAPVGGAASSAPLPPLPGTRPILIRVPQRVIRSFKIEAERTGGSYQTLMNRALRQAAERFV